MAKFWASLFICLTFALFRSCVVADLDLAKDAVDFALKVYNHNSRENFLFKLLSFDFKKIQVIAGIEFIIDAELELTNCKKGDNDYECSLENKRHSLRKQLCHFVVVVFGERKGLLQSVCKNQQ